MKRRQVIALIGALSGGGALAAGTGAFTSVNADRDVAVQVATDASAYLSIDKVPGSPNSQQHVEQNNGELAINVSTSNDGGSGVNLDAVTVFEDLFEVGNQGTQDVEVGVTPLSFVEANGGNTTLIVLIVPESGFPTNTISPGTTETYDMVVTATDSATSSTDLSDTITVSGEAP
jgi:hypothetical protein